MFQRLFWPSGDNAGDADALGQGGFWICIVLGFVGSLAMVVAGSPILGLLLLFYYWLAGMGVREHSTAAAVLLASTSLLNCIASMIGGNPPGGIAMLTTLIFLANIRSTHIAARWAKSGDPAEIPERQSQTFFDLLCDQMPPRIWPIGKYFFFTFAGIWLLLSVVGVAALAFHLTPQRHAARQPTATQQLEVAPPR